MSLPDELPPYLRDAGCLDCFPDVQLVSAPTSPGADPGSRLRLSASRLVLSAASPLLRGVLQEHEASHPDAESPLSILTELPAACLAAFGKFVLTGRLPKNAMDDEHVRSSFLCLGIDLAKMEMGVADDEDDVVVRPAAAKKMRLEASPPLPKIVLPKEPLKVIRWTPGKVKTDPRQLFVVEQERDPLTDCENDLAETLTDIFVKESDFGPVQVQQIKGWKNAKTKKPRGPDAPPRSKREKEYLFRCDHCPFSAVHSQEFALHVIKTHKNANLNHDWFCLFCESGFETKKDLEEHEKAVHPKRRLQCRFCELDYPFTQHRHFLAHVAQHGNTPKFLYCAQCGKQYKDRKGVQMHMNNCGPYHVSECVQCPRGSYPIISWTEHQKHIEEMHSGTFQHVCGICPQLFDTEELRREHHRTDHPDGLRTKVCDICGDTMSAVLLPKHIALHKSGEKLVSRSIRKNIMSGGPRRSYRKISGLAHHLNKQFLPSDYEDFYDNMPCEVCKKPQRFRDGYRAHFVRLHLPDGEKPYQCRQCPKGFASEHTRDDHENVHKNLKPYKCRFDGCQSAFTHDSNRAGHENGVHKGLKRVRSGRVSKM